jgi:hypothetical protein
MATKRTPPAVRKGEATPDNLLNIARLAAAGDASALREIKRVANELGWVGLPGGWIYGPTRTKAVCQGWMALAEHMLRGHFWPRRYREFLEGKG